MSTVLHYRIRAVLAAALLSTPMYACDSVTGEEQRWRRDLAYSPTLELPASSPITAGVPFTVQVRSVAPNSTCSRPGEADVRLLQAGTVAEVTVYDHFLSGPRTCTNDPQIFSRAVQLQFAAPGTYLIQLRGRESFTQPIMITAEYPVIVGPAAD